MEAQLTRDINMVTRRFIDKNETPLSPESYDAVLQLVRISFCFIALDLAISGG